MSGYAKPRSLEEALSLLAGGDWRVIAGGTDFFPATAARPIRENVLDINGLAGLCGIGETATHRVIGARTRWSDLAKAHMPASFAALQQAAAEVGSVQIQNAGTVGGNLCNASPAADGVPPLLVLDAEVELRSLSGTRHVPLAAFIIGNRRTARRGDELLTAIRVPRTGSAGASHFIKLGARRYMVISIAMAAARIAIGGDGRIEQAAVGVGACSAAAVRLDRLEASLIGARPQGAVIASIVGASPLDGLSPIDDVRGSAAYRLEAAREIVLRALMGACGIESHDRVAAA